MTTPKKYLYLDFETRSRVDLRKSNVYRYVEDPDFTILMATWSVDKETVHLETTREGILSIPGILDPEVTIVAHNAPFERITLSAFSGLPVGEYLDPSRFTDTMALAAQMGYPRKLDALAKALGTELKDSAGTALINFFCKPNRKGEFNSPEDYPEKWKEFCDYGIQDTLVLVEIHDALAAQGAAELTAREELVNLSDQKINDAGITVDREMVRTAIDATETNRMVHELRISEITGIANPGSNPQLLGWLTESGLPMPNLQKDTVSEYLDRDDLSEEQREVLQLRQEIALVASSKYTAALDRVNSDGKLRGSFQYFGAHTGRWSGRGVQLQNLPSASLDGSEDRDPDELIAEAILDLKLSGEAGAKDLKALVRPMFSGPFTVVDYSAIEARVLAWLAGEKWAIDAFSAGRDIYVETAERMGQGMTRKEGKVAVLALGYNGGIGSLAAMGAEGSDEQLQVLVRQWRDANPRIVRMWPKLEDAFIYGSTVGKLIRVEKDGKDRAIVLPSGRRLIYHGLKGKREPSPWGGDRIRLSYLDPQRPGFRKDTYGGRLTENVTQAVARDILASALVRLHDRGYEIALHVHDEIGVLGTHPVEEISRIMTEDPGWASGLPLAAEGYHCPRYRKD